ncbi:ESS family glutamate:Na+ symporter [Geomicrobium halophilum]|uniref:ESS family glutamate:Na+ symporter n=1 Tax=Geomicrobium halophilum TaxID=549000 RepID=A0A841PKV4_9BACL|nr:sodium/glutamate symporter [Geomicrobium halophilum]MBB6448324.1 ESS family glutamate:Na+ symporter [Geomicrobium halophilum]
MSLEVVGFALIVLSIILIIGKWIRLKVPLFQKLFLPSSLIGGFFALLLGPEVLGRITDEQIMPYGIFTEDMFEVWSELPGLLINVIFASLFIGFAIPRVQEIWRTGGPQVALGYTISWAQYVAGILLAVTVLSPIFNLDPAVGALIEISFVGGHGTAAGLGGTFEAIGFEEGQDLALGLATIGLLSGVIVGIILINWAARKGKSRTLNHPDDISIDQRTGVVKKEHRESAGELTTSPISIEPLAFHLGLVGLAIFIGYFILEALVWLEDVTWGSAWDLYLFEYVPLFPIAMIGGIIIQVFIAKTDKVEIVDHATISRIQGLALDLLIVSAMATLSLAVIGDNIIPFVILAVVGVTLNIIMFMYLAPRMIPNYWFERGMGDFGQSMGVAATGILLMRIVDPENKTPALKAFGYKQILFEPMVGGGLVTAASIPFILQFGPIPVLIAATILMIAFWLLGVLYFGKNKAEKNHSVRDQ